jgi:hypothetical protein
MTKPRSCGNTPGPLTIQQLECIVAIGNFTAQQLREILDFDPATGLFVWRKRPLEMFGGDVRVCNQFNSRLAGRTAGSIGKRDGYVQLLRHFGHRLAWLHFYGEWPKHMIDHVNGVRSDNRIENLRDVLEFINHQNLRRRPANGHRDLPFGVSLSGNASNPYKSRIRVDGKIALVGTFKTASDAHAAYIEAKRRLHEGCTI